MTSFEIIEELAKNHVVEDLVNHISSYKTWDKDLANDIYIVLLEKDPELIESLYNANQLNYYIVRIIKNNVISKTSPYYLKYMNYEHRKSLIDDHKEL